MISYKKNIIKVGKKLEISSKNSLIVNTYKMEKYLKSKIESYNHKINTSFDDNKKPRERS